jgi:CRISPR system Cascade subunit CasE
MTLHLVRLPIDMRSLSAFAVASGASDDDGGYALHLALRGRFGAAGPQPFRLMEGRDGAVSLLGYVPDPDALGDAAALPPADALLDRLFGTAELREMPAAWRTGARYRFDLRARPVVRFGGRVREARAARDGAWLNRGGKAAQEVDAFIAACERAGEGVPVDRGAVYHDWLARLLAPAAELEECQLRQFRRIKSKRSSHGKPGSGKVEGPEAVMAGTLVIREPDAFAHLLARGVGRHAAFGFGMLLLSPPGRLALDGA